GERAGDGVARDGLDDSGAHVPDEDESREDDEDRDHARAVVPRHGVEPGQRRGHDRPVERLQPGLAEVVVEADRPDDQRRDEACGSVREPPRPEGARHGRSILDAWTPTAPSASSTSTSTRSRWPASTRTSPTSPSPTTSSR